MATVHVQFQIDDAQLIPGAPGLSAYEVAVANGFTGTETEWLNSLQPSPAGSGADSAINLIDFGGTLTGDNTPALNAALDACVFQGKRIISIPAGVFGFSSLPKAINGVRLLGSGKTATLLSRNYSGDFLKFAGGLLGGGGAEDMAIVAGAGTAGGCGILLYGDSDETPDFCLLKNLYVSTHGGTFAVPLMVDGQARNTPQGVRNIRVENCDFFAGTAAAMWLANAVGVYMNNVGTYPAGGTNGDIQIGSGSTIISMSNMNCQGALILGQCSRVRFDGHLNSLNSSSAASQCYITGTRTGSVVNNLTNSFVSLV